MRLPGVLPPAWSLAQPHPARAHRARRNAAASRGAPSRGASASWFLRIRATSLVQYLVEIEQLIRQHRERCELIHRKCRIRLGFPYRQEFARVGLMRLVVVEKIRIGTCDNFL